MPVPVISSRYRQRRPSYNTMYLPPYHPSDLSDSINDAVKALNHMNEKSASAWIDIRRMENPFDELMTSELPFRKSIRELAFSADHTANAFERIYTEAEFNGKIRKREEEISHVLGLMQDGVQRSKEVDDLAQQCKQSVKSLEHNRALCEQAQMSGNDIGKGTIFLQIKVGWDNPFEEVTLKTVGKLKLQIESEVNTVHADYMFCLIEFAALRNRFNTLHQETTRQADTLRKFIREHDVDTRRQILASRDGFEEKDQAQELEMRAAEDDSLSDTTSEL